MQSFPPTIVLRHRKENLKKCSLRGLESRQDFLFFTYPFILQGSDCFRFGHTSKPRGSMIGNDLILSNIGSFPIVEPQELSHISKTKTITALQHTTMPDFSHHLLLAVDAPPLQKEDAERGIFIVDATWRYAAQMLKHPELQKMEMRSIPQDYRTAYPRCQQDCPDPERGLASIEAIYIAYKILGHSTEGLLDGYYWRDLFLKKNGFDI